MVVNAEDPLFTGRKLLNKKLAYHTGFVGQLRTYEYRAILNKKPELLVLSKLILVLLLVEKVYAKK